MKKLIGLASIFALLVVGYIAYDPYLTVSNIKTGIAERDSEQLADNIDFPTLRQNLKEQLSAVMVQEATKKLDDNPFAALAAGLVTQVADGFVDSLVTPSGLAALMEGKQPSQGGASNNSEPTQKEKLFKQARFSYDSLSKFSIWVKNDEGKEVRFVLARDGLTW